MLEEDEYEAKLGDRRFLYLRAAFLDKAAALAHRGREAGLRKDSGTLGTRRHLKRIELIRDEVHDRLLLDSLRDPAERLMLQDVVRILATP
jgi:hypothetical protein